MRPIVPLLFVSLCALAQPNEEFFEKKVRPVLVTRCQGCHNAKMKTGGLDLSSGPLSVPPERLAQVVAYETSVKMPPMAKLGGDELAALTAWAKAGAPWPGAARTIASEKSWTPEQKNYWAFQPVRQPEMPRVREESWIRTPVDRFILAALESKGLSPAPPATKAALLRRVTFDLTGLPPSIDEVREFLADSSPDAYARLVDRLLDSPRYGERWGRHWLDVARYADSTGNDEDHRYPYAWRYRDYVIDAFNRDLPFDQFVREQIAGDLLASEGVNRNGIVATGFLALGPKALAQQDKKKMLYDVYDEQIDVTSKAFLGVTLACARCHDHKFDPFSQKDYYAMAGIFASTKSFSGKGGVSQMLYTPLCDRAEYRTYENYKRWLSAKQRQINDVYDIRIEERAGVLAGRMADYMVAAREVYERGKPADDVASKQKLDVRVLRRWADYLKDGAAGRPHLEAWAGADAAGIRAVAEQYQTKYLAKFAEYSRRLADWRTKTAAADAAMKAAPGKPGVDAEAEPFFTDVTFNGPFKVSDARRRDNDVMNLDKDEETQRKRAEQARREREMTVTRDELLTDADRAQLKILRGEFDDMKQLAPPEPEMADAVAEGDPVEQHVFIRGDYNSPGDVAPRSFPAVLGGPRVEPSKQGSGRRELAEWMASPENPLTARVFVNRVWGWHFGEGIVRTPDNFGRMGERPTHPELLDWLASEFARSGWSVKQLHRTILLSSAYRMSSAVSDEAAAKDPENRLLSRFNRQRLEIEELRDAMLAADGTIDYTMGGTLQKGFGTDGENSGGRLSLNPEKLTRRTVYLPLRRANLPTLLNLFDFGDATTPNGKRVITTVAPQALFAMNSEFAAARARNIALRALEDTGIEDGARAEQIFLRVLNRQPEAAEKDAALSFLASYRRKFTTRTETEAWQSLCRVLLASNEFIYVD